jgi:hypothetical protein
MLKIEPVGVQRDQRNSRRQFCLEEMFRITR